MSQIEPTPVIPPGTLAPKFDDAQHAHYLRLLEQSIQRPTDLNIALAGPYGSGKSSILEEFRRKHVARTMRVAVSSFMRLSPSREVESEETSPARANAIQKEIVKQILYQEGASSLPASRFNRISDSDAVSWIGPITLGALGSAVLFLTKALTRVEAHFHGHKRLLALYLCVWLALTLGALAIQRPLRARFSIEKISAGPASIVLANESKNSYFDQYLDEIVYYFSRSKKDIVIFEDIDRFDDLGVFEDLRSLNTLLNSASDIGHPIRFIYAVRDSIFAPQQLDATAQVEVERDLANRTKFFDFVIPVVPFLTQRNSSDLIARELSSREVDPGLIEIAGRYLTDMRTVKSLRNELDTYTEVLLKGENCPPGLNETRLFALLLFKTFHTRDFEAIRRGDSTLDRIHRIWRKMIASRLDELTTETSKLIGIVYKSNRRTRQISVSAKRLTEVLDVVSGNLAGPGSSRLQLGGVQYLDADFSSEEFWSDISDGKTIHLKFGGYYAPVSASQLSSLLGMPLPFSPASKSEVEKARKELAQTRVEIEQLKHHSWQEACHEIHWGKPTGGLPYASFEDLVRGVSDSELLLSLIEGGYVDMYFSLYVSNFYGGNTTANVMNFVIHHVDANTADPLYELTGDEVAQLVSKYGTSLFGSRAVANVHVLDYILEESPEKAHSIFEVIDEESLEEEFFKAYWVAGKSRASYLRNIAPQDHLVLERICSLAEDGEDFDSAIQATLESVNPDRRYEVTEDSIAKIAEAVPRISALADDRENMASRAAQVLLDLGLVFDDLNGISGQAVKVIVSRHSFVPTADNVRRAIDVEDINLQELKAEAPDVYSTILSDPAAFLNSLRPVGVEPPIVRSDAPEGVTGEWFEATGGVAFDSFVSRIDPGARLDLNKLPVPSWTSLLDGGLIELTTDVFALVWGELGEIPDALIDEVRRSKGKLQGKSLDSDNAKGVSIALLDPANRLPITYRILAAKAVLKNPLESKQMPCIDSDLWSRAMGAGVLDDSLESLIEASRDWPTLKSLLGQSQFSDEFISAGYLPARAIPEFLDSSELGSALKDGLVDAWVEKYASSLPAAQEAMARHLHRSGATPDDGTLNVLAASGAGESLLLLLEACSDDTFSATLGKMHSPYRELVAKSGARPLLPDDPVHEKLVERLIQLRFVSSSRHGSGPGVLRVFTRRS